ncbi:MAG: flavodoxin [Filifactoraceae bacterium]
MEKIGIFYWSGSGNTEAMAEAIAIGAREAGAEVIVKSVSSAKETDVNEFSKVILGCPSMGDEILEESEFEPFFTGVESTLKSKKVALFGSYGWGDGKWMRDWVERCESAGIRLYDEGLIVSGSPEGVDCQDFGKGFARY